MEANRRRPAGEKPTGRALLVALLALYPPGLRIIRTEHSELVTACGKEHTWFAVIGGDVACAGGLVAPYMKKHTCQQKAGRYDFM